MQFRRASIIDISHIQAVEKEFYGFTLPTAVLRDWIENLGENFIVAEEGGRLVGCIFWEKLEEINAIPYLHSVEDYHKPEGEYFYISEVGILNQNLDLLQQLFDKVMESAKKGKIKSIIWLTGVDKEGHNAVERALLDRNGFEKTKHVKRWEYAPGKFSADHWLFVKEL